MRGWRPAEIALELGVSETQVRNDIREAASVSKAAREALADDYIQRELDALDALERSISSAAHEGMAALAAAKVILDIKARRAKYLGLDKPQEVKHTMSLEQLLDGD